MRSKKQVIYPQLQIYEKQNLLDRLVFVSLKNRLIKILNSLSKLLK